MKQYADNQKRLQFGSLQISKQFSQSNENFKQINKQLKRYQNLKIIDISIDLSQNLASSRHGDQQTPYFNALIQNQTKLKAFARESIQKKQLEAVLQSSQTKQSQIKMQIQEQLKNNITNIENLSNIKASTLQKSLNNYQQNSQQTKTNQNQITSSFKKKPFVFKQFCISQPKIIKNHQSIDKNFGMNQQIQFNNPRQELNDLRFSKQENDKHFNWESNQRQLRRVDTICYKSCVTCQRRIPQNNLVSSIIQISILSTFNQSNNQFTHQSASQSTNQSSKNQTEFIATKFAKKHQRQQIKNKVPKSKTKTLTSPQVKQKSFSATSNFSWLKKVTHQKQTNFQNTKPQQKLNVSLTIQNNRIQNKQSPLTVLIQKCDSQKVLLNQSLTMNLKNLNNMTNLTNMTNLNNMTNLTNMTNLNNMSNLNNMGNQNLKLNKNNQYEESNKKEHHQLDDKSSKTKNFLSFKASKQLKFPVKNPNNTNISQNQTKYRSPRQRDIEGKVLGVSSQKNLIISHRSVDKKIPQFIRKDSLKEQFKIAN